MHLRLLPMLLMLGPLACATGPGLLPPEVPVAAVHREPGTLRVMTFNIQSGARGLDGVARVIRASVPDVVALQEVDVGSARAGGVDQVEALARLTGLPHRAHFRTTDLHGGAYGIALLSRFPLEALAQYPLPNPVGAEPRTLAHAVMDVDGREVSVYLTHLIRRPFNARARLRQSAFVANLLARDTRPHLLMGDLNDDPDSNPLRLLRRQMKDVVAATGGARGTYPMPLFLPTLRIDYVLACDAFTPVASRVLRVDASDHYPVVADLRLDVPDSTAEADAALSSR
ncbi:endonuclease/exonuclease/phosphatase family protein [Myxococcus sp. MISCRS1]|uniref:endonuclease/exonuclease/phosphatase family protein n=1 Tax=Myxococcus sp. MISCRS1 TaxID=2996786 RepID=UPI002270663A|nr:endonuclease/exonuclease/phosphatase family protein [Myxococcus sp. MISCRS1]MCY1000640.1 endonuclease/exonuclease/phosphatase family protein [Myxococcus sp. MISCRS1]